MVHAVVVAVVTHLRQFSIRRCWRSGSVILGLGLYTVRYMVIITSRRLAYAT
jgi:hypothetical protein